jgi:DNA mismatch repair protein MutS
MAKQASAETPLMQQHAAIKARYPDAVLLFRVGDFYETFGQDAVIASGVLGITLTKRNNGNAASAELAGFPHHALETYLHKLVKAGYRVAICDQLEDPKQTKGIVKRGVTELVTPGVATSDKLLEHNQNNFLAAIHFTEQQLGIAFLDISTGEFFAAEGDEAYIDKLLQSLKPAEVIFARQKLKPFKEKFGTKFFTYGLEEWVFTIEYTTETLLKHFNTHSLKGFGIEFLQQGTIAAGAILHYLKDTEHPNLGHITSIQRIDKDEHMWMDRFTIKNLELVGFDGQHGLLQVLDQTQSPMGARLLKRWLLMPLKDEHKINERLNAVAQLVHNTPTRNTITQHIKQAGDVERLASKVPLKKINPKEVLQIAKGLHEATAIKTICGNMENAYFKKLADIINPCPFLVQKIETVLVPNPPSLANKGGVIANGIDEELDTLRKIASGGKDYLIEIQQREAATTGIASLKISYNNVFGYYLEVTNLHKNKVPNTWIRKQTLANAERYITPELKEYEEKILGAEDKIFAIEQRIYDALLQELTDYIGALQTNGSAIAVIDVLASFATIAISNKYTQPVICADFVLEFKDSRHPVIEKNLAATDTYITNDIVLDNNNQQIIILTGPNMSGKSALLRQTALITLMAHIGCFVPASSAIVPLTDKIFTRVGASDNLSGGESTFMVEMNETASIINNLTPHSLILLDEIGRGTSTYDGISIAWSIVEHLFYANEKPKTLFATHYHELNELENKLPRVKNYHITNKEVGNKIIFLRKLAPGGSVHSFGIHVAQMAGMPPSLISRANQILKQLEDSRENNNTNDAVKQLNTPKVQLSIFDTHSTTFEDIRNRLNTVDINRLTPVEALLKLQEIKGLIN